MKNLKNLQNQAQSIAGPVIEFLHNESIDSNSSQSLNLQKWENLNYYCTNLLEASTISFADISVDQVDIHKIQEQFQKVKMHQKQDMKNEVIYDPLKYFKQECNNQEKETLICYQEIQTLCLKAIQCYGILMGEDATKGKKVNSYVQPNFKNLQIKINSDHKSNNKNIFNSNKLIFLKTICKKNKVQLSSRKIKKNLCSIHLFKEIQYLYYDKGITKKQICSRFKIPLFRVNKILCQQQIIKIGNIHTYLGQNKYLKLHQSIDKQFQNLFKVQHQQYNALIFKVYQEISKIQSFQIQLQEDTQNLNQKCRIDKQNLLLIDIIYKNQNFYDKFQLNGKNLINIDESIISETDHRKFGWFKIGQNNFQTHSQRLASVSIIAGISTDGALYYSLAYGKNNSATFMLFFIKIIEKLEQLNNEWRSTTIFVLDNASYHRSKLLMEFYQEMKILILFLGPYSFKLAPVEFFFSYIKQKDLNILKAHAETKCQILRLIKEISFAISKFDYSWIKQGFRHTLTAALDFLSLQNI